MEEVVKWAHANPFLAFILIIVLGGGIMKIIFKALNTVRDIGTAHVKDVKNAKCCDRGHTTRTEQRVCGHGNLIPGPCEECGAP